MDKKWKIFIVSHKQFIPKMCHCDPMFNSTNYCILNVGNEKTIEHSEGLEVINQFELPHAVSLGKWWAESEGIYNIWLSNKYSDLDYIGFIHYDKELRLIKKYLFPNRMTNITSRINEYISGEQKAHISFENHNMRRDYGQKIMADINHPNELTGDGLNCYDYLLNDYNTYFSTQYTLEDLFRCKCINLCSCFLVDYATFDKMMKFFQWVILQKRLEPFDTNHMYRFQGGMAERYFGLFLAFEYRKNKDLSIIHHYNEGIK